jgi:hypothetical protein
MWPGMHITNYTVKNPAIYNSCLYAKHITENIKKNIYISITQIDLFLKDIRTVNSEVPNPMGLTS